MTPLRILIVDDMPQVRQDLRTALALAGEAAGLQLEIVGEAGDGRMAVRHAGALRPEVVLMDLEMPLLDGYTATRQIKAFSPGIRIIALTVHGDPESREKALQAGVDSLIVKGEAVQSLLDALFGRNP